MRYYVQIGDNNFEVDIKEKADLFKVILNGKPYQVDLKKINNSSYYYSLIINNRSYEIIVDEQEDVYTVRIGDEIYTAKVEDEQKRQFAQLDIKSKVSLREQQLRAPMPGLVVAVEVKQGELVKPGQGVVIVEAMKMENELKASREGTVKEIHVKKGDTVDKNQLLITFRINTINGGADEPG